MDRPSPAGCSPKNWRSQARGIQFDLNPGVLPVLPNWPWPCLHAIRQARTTLSFRWLDAAAGASEAQTRPRPALRSGGVLPTVGNPGATSRSAHLPGSIGAMPVTVTVPTATPEAIVAGSEPLRASPPPADRIARQHAGDDHQRGRWRANQRASNGVSMTIGAICRWRRRWRARTPSASSARRCPSSSASARSPASATGTTNTTTGRP